MEERLIDKDESRKIKIKRTEDGMDAVDGLTPDSDEDEAFEDDAEFIVELPEEEGGDEEYDDDLVGLTPSQLKARLEAKKRAEERARAEYQKLVEGAEKHLKEENYEEAEPLYAQAALYEVDDGSAKRGLWLCRTRGYTEIEAFFDRDIAQEFYWADDAVREEVLRKMEGRVREERAALIEEAKPLRETYNAGKEERAEAFRANRTYYLVRTFIVFAVVIALAVASGVCANYIMRRSDSLMLILTIAFAACAFIVFVVALTYALKTAAANRLCRANEKLSSTEDGARLAELEEKIDCLDLILGENMDEEEEN